MKIDDLNGVQRKYKYYAKIIHMQTHTHTHTHTSTVESYEMMKMAAKGYRIKFIYMIVYVYV